ncbi:MAG: HAMP domain-containing histidine kinase, partial [Erysipelotrichaceae bacterium]|nr:HAMP domain-containing histidine kinase [Erysipelotrichaceae bacterium]
MRRIQKWLAGLSLAQQLISIILCSSIVFFLLFFVYVRSSITTIAATQTYEMLESWQDFVISTYKKGGYNYENYESSQYEVSHVVFKKGKQVDFIGTYLHDQDMSMAYNMIMNNPTGQRRGYSAFQSAHTIYYLLGEIDNNTQILSFVDRSYANAIENTLFTSVSNISAVVVALLFVLLLLWVTSLLHPLNQIRTYIEKIRNGEDPTLQIDRSDEIGEVAFALVNMREELKKQDEIKEEMIHNISHDLKTPIATIKSYGESIKDGIYPYETLEKSVDVIIENADRLERKVHSLLFLNRLDYLLSSSEHVIVDIDMKELVNSVLLSLKVIRPEITITTELEEIKFRGDDESWRVLVEN